MLPSDSPIHSVGGTGSGYRTEAGQLNNEVMLKVAVDKSRLAARARRNIGMGYKEHVSMDRQLGLIHKMATTPAQLPNAQCPCHVCPTQLRGGQSMPMKAIARLSFGGGAMD